MLDVIIKRFEQPDEARDIPEARFELVQLGGLTIGRAIPHDSWVVGPDRYLSLHFLGADRYAK